MSEHAEGKPIARRYSPKTGRILARCIAYPHLTRRIKLGYTHYVNEPKVLLTGLWQRESRRGNVYYQVRLGVAKIVMLKNTAKQSETEPDYLLYAQERALVTAPKDENTPLSMVPRGDELPNF
jgi:hypothetical protein